MTTLSSNGVALKRVRKTDIETSKCRPTPVSVHADGIPDELKALPNWVCWRYKRRDDKWTKVPIDPATGRNAKPNDASTWSSFDDALAGHNKNGIDGIGFVFSESDPYCGIDLDDCRDPSTKQLDPWASEIVKRFASYTDISPSRTGVKIFIKGALAPGSRNRVGNIEVYDRGRFFCVTGRRHKDTPDTIKNKPNELKRFHAETFPAQESPHPAAKTDHAAALIDAVHAAVALTDEEIVDEAKAAKNGNKFSALWNGDHSGYKSQSEADLALCSLLSFWTGGDRGRIDELFRKSQLYRDKWDRDDYRTQVIDKAVEGRTEFYKPPKKDSAASKTPYRVDNGKIVHDRMTKDGITSVPLCNFDARIVEQLTIDDGVEKRISLTVSGKLAEGPPPPQVDIPAADFASMSWVVPSFGTRAVVAAGMGSKDHLRAAMQMLSVDVKTKHVYAHTGWREINSVWFYLHANGAIGETNAGEVAVSLPDPLARFALPGPLEGKALAGAIGSAIRFIDLAPVKVTVPLLASVFRSVLSTADFALHLSGPTGAGKTELAALCQQFFGCGLDARHLPGSWSSTGNSLEALAFVAKDALFVTDDFAPHGSQHDIARYHREADRLIRAQGNLAGRGRCRADGTVKAAKPPRGLVLSTGEDVPRGQSLRSRLFILELSPGDVVWDKLTDAQGAAAHGAYAGLLAAFIRWLAPRIAKIRKKLPTKVAALRAELSTEGQHARTPGIAADLLIGLHYFAKFASACGVDGVDGHLPLWKEAVLQAAADQAAHVQAAEPTAHFLRLLSAVIVSGRAHFAGVDTDRPKNASHFGWRDEHPLGRCIGWVKGDDLYLSPDAAFAEAQKLAAEQGESLTVAARTLWKRCKERGLLVAVDERRQRSTVRRVVAGIKREVIHLPATCLHRHIRPSILSTGAKKVQKHGTNSEISVDGRDNPTVHLSKNRPPRPSTEENRVDGRVDGRRGYSTRPSTEKREKYEEK
jgi:hypothetical protein